MGIYDAPLNVELVNEGRDQLVHVSRGQDVINPNPVLTIHDIVEVGRIILIRSIAKHCLRLRTVGCGRVSVRKTDVTHCPCPVACPTVPAR